MKKNKMMRLASCLLVAVMLTTSVISGTFAKYVTSDSATTSARVARWGFDTTTITLDDLFAASYDEGKVLSSDLSKVIAPGTTGSQTIVFDTESGAAPEVAYSFTVEATSVADDDDNDIIDNPNIKWAFYKQGETKTFGTFAEMLTAINGMTEPQINPDNLPKLSDVYVIEWKWIFDENAANKEGDTSNYDSGDTLMGNAGNGVLTELEKIDLTISITATQID